MNNFKKVQEYLKGILDHTGTVRRYAKSLWGKPTWEQIKGSKVNKDIEAEHKASHNWFY